MRSARAAAFFAATLSALPFARAELPYDARIDVPITAAAGATWISIALFGGSPDTCSWCDRDADGTDSLNGLDRGARNALLWTDVDTADALSNVSANVLAPLSALGLMALAGGLEGRISSWPVDALVIGESVAIAQALNHVTKLFAGRERPRYHALSQADRDALEDRSQLNVSFYSAHTSFTFSLAVAAGTVAHLEGYDLEPVIWISGLLLAAITGYLRIAADQHYATDVLVGAALGSAIGFAIPTLLHRPDVTAEGPTGLAFRF